MKFMINNKLRVLVAIGCLMASRLTAQQEQMYTHYDFNSMAMNPASSVSGFYLAHPDARYFNVGKISADQIEDLAKRRGESIEDVRRQLASLID
jgi:hypothetical protein